MENPAPGTGPQPFSFRPTLREMVAGILLALGAAFLFNWLYQPYLRLATPAVFRAFSCLLGLGCAGFAGAVYFIARGRRPNALLCWVIALVAPAIGFIVYRLNRDRIWVNGVEQDYAAPLTALLFVAWLGAWLLTLVWVFRLNRQKQGPDRLFWGGLAVIALLVTVAGCFFFQHKGLPFSHWRYYGTFSTIRLVAIFWGLAIGITLLARPFRKAWPLLAAHLVATGLVVFVSSDGTRITAGECSAIATLRTLNTAQQQYNMGAGAGRYGPLATLSATGPLPYLDSVMGAGTKSGYTFVITLGPGGRSYSVRSGPACHGYEFILDPWGRYFFTDEGAVIYHATSPDVDASSSPID